jgi:chromosome segregation ATPase
VFKQESAALEEKINGLNTAIKEKEKEFQSRLDAREREWRKTEETLLAEKTVRDAALAALKYENETSLREKEALLREREQLQGTARSHMDDFERRLQIERDRAGEALRQKEQELAQLKAVHFEFEATIRREAEQKYRSQIERLEREKDEVSQGVAQEIQSLRRSLQAEMQGVEEQFGQERIELKNKLKEKENGIAELQEKLGETLQHLKSEQDRNQNTVSEGKRTWDVERTELLRQLQENRAALERLDNTYREQFSLRTPPTTPAQPVIIAVEEAVPAATHDVPVIDAADAGISRYISRFWQDINKPVIEINFKGDSETKN